MATPQTIQMANFAHGIQYEDLDADIVDQLKRHLLDSLGSLIQAVEGPPIQKLMSQVQLLGCAGPCPLPGGHFCSIDRAAQVYTALIRYPDWMDGYYGKKATCHPSDNTGALLALSQSGVGNSHSFLAALAAGYAIECRLTEEIPVMVRGFDHTALLAFSLAAAISRMLRLPAEQTANALALAGSFINPLITSRASYTSEWKGLVSSLVAQDCVELVLLAREGMTGPLTIFEGPKGYQEAYSMTLEHDWNKEDLQLIKKCALKAYNAEAHAQPALEALQEIRQEHAVAAGEIESIDITTFQAAFDIVGGGAYGDRKTVHSKEQADHSLPYLAAVLLLDGEVHPEQLTGGRIGRADVQALLEKVRVHPLDGYTQIYPEELACTVEVTMRDGRRWSKEKKDYHGYYTRPLGWKEVEEKFRRLTDRHIDPKRQDTIVQLCQTLENVSIGRLVPLLLG